MKVFNERSYVPKTLLSWTLFWTTFAYFWKIRNIFTHIPGYGDVLEVLWGINWYYESLFINHVSPFFTNLIFHPLGWHTATLAHTPMLFLIAQPLYRLGGVAFAYNILFICSLIVAFGGMIRLMSKYTSSMLSIIVAISFLSAIWISIGGHLHMAWEFALLPWMLWTIDRTKHHSFSYKWIILCGIIWGLMINFHLQGIFFGAIVFSFLGKKLFDIKQVRRILLGGLIALVIGLPTILLYFMAGQTDQIHHFGIEHNISWGASLNSLFIPSVFHPISFFRNISELFYTGPKDESGVMNFGLFTSFFAIFGAIIVLSKQRQHTGFVWLTLVGIVLGLGPLLRWNGQVVQHPVFRPLNVLIWRLGHIFKPHFFINIYPDLYFENGVPLPGLVLSALFPFWEWGRTVSRYAVIGMLGALVLTGMALQHLPRGIRYLLMAIWLIERLPHPSGNVPVPFDLHPAYVWIAHQDLEPGEGIADISYPTLKMGGEILWATAIHGKPNVSGVGSFWPEHTFALWNYLLDKTALSRPETGEVFRYYGVRYVLLHIQGDREREMWAMLLRNPNFRAVGCWDPPLGPAPWPYPICVAEVLAARKSVILLGRGWSGREEWGVWAEGLRAEAGWLAMTQAEHRLRIGAFPFCVPGKYQEMSIWINGKPIGKHRWEDCGYWEGEVRIPAAIVRKGWNQIGFEFSYALSPFEVTKGQNGDRRMLSVGFTILEIIK